MNHEYIFSVEFHKYGWLVCAPNSAKGIPCDAIDKLLPMMPADAVLDLGIAHHYRAVGHAYRRVYFAITTSVNSKLWRQEIDEYLKDFSPAVRWLWGTDVGMSSAAIFGVLAGPEELRKSARDYGKAAAPRDPADLGRCLRLLAIFPEWRARLPEVAAAYPDTTWSKIVARWGELETADPKRQYEILNECNK